MTFRWQLKTDKVACLKFALCKIIVKRLISMLSVFAAAFKESVVLAPHKKYGNDYPESFTGKEAIVFFYQDVICKILDSSDRSMALMLGNALDKQSFILDVTRNHRLRDSPKFINSIFMERQSHCRLVCLLMLPLAILLHAEMEEMELAATRTAVLKDSVKVELPTDSDALRIEHVAPRRETTWTQSVPFSAFSSLTSNKEARNDL
jgi:hypothetical protein